MFNIFLDLDGVLVTQRCTKSWVKHVLPYGKEHYSNLCFDEGAVFQFLRFLECLQNHCEYRIILSSDWRWNNPEDSTRALFDKHGIPQYADITPVRDPETHGIRGKEILAWIKLNKAEEEPYLAIDDINCKPYVPNRNFVYVNGGWHSNGFNKWHFRHALVKAQLQLGIDPATNKGFL